MNKKNIPIVTTILIIINIAVFLVMEFTGSTENTQFLYDDTERCGYGQQLC